MSQKQILLDTATFLDSGPSIMLAAPDRDGQRLVIEAFLDVCYNELGVAPRLLDGDGMRTLLRSHLPAHFKPKDPLVRHVPDVLDAFIEHQTAIANVPFAFEMRLGLQDAEQDFLTATAESRSGTRAPKKQDPFQHGAQKLGRNDPCSCGSGKKYKKCHGKKDGA